MPIQFSDVSQLCSLGLAIAALGIGVDSVMVPRLEKLRDSALGEAKRVCESPNLYNRIKHARETADSEHGGRSIAKSLANFDLLEGYRDDLAARKFFQELSSRVFFGGSIVRSLLATMIAFVVVLILAVLGELQAPATVSQSKLSQVTLEVLMWTFVAAGKFKTQNLAIITTLIITYQAFSLGWYTKKWRTQLSELTQKNETISGIVGKLEIYQNLRLPDGK